MAGARSSPSQLVFFHAHPDDEVLLTGGTIAALADAGHRITIVTATDGLMGERPPGGAPRVVELERSAHVLGAAHAATLDYADSGKGPVLYPDPADRCRFARAPLEEAAGRLAAHLDGAAVLVHYDEAGGYHHPDHVRVHEVGAAAARLADTPTVLEATFPRERLVILHRLLGWTGRSPYTAEQARTGGTPRREIDLTARVAATSTRKLAALREHSSVVGTGASGRMIDLVLRCPPVLLGPVLGREYFRTTRGNARELFHAAGLARP